MGDENRWTGSCPRVQHGRYQGCLQCSRRLPCHAFRGRYRPKPPPPRGGVRYALIPDAHVYHKRRTTYRQFFKQVYNFGIARINLHLLHPGSMKAVHTLPALFVVGMALLLILSIFYPALLWIPIGYSLLLFLDSLFKNRSVKVALHSIIASWIQLIGYGSGFLVAAWKRLVRREGEFSAFAKKFYE